MKSFYYRITTSLHTFITAWHGLVAAGLLAVMFGLGITSMMGDSAIVDEVAHIPAGYSYLHYGDFRLNPEHPPLIKDLAGLPLQFMGLKFPDQQPAWTTDINGQWEAGWNFLYHIGNNADAILFWSRLPILVLAIVFGALMYRLVQRRFGVSVGLLALFFYALSPNIIAHARYVTTDLGASVFIFLALVMFVRYIEQPSRGNLFVLSLSLAAAQLAKFSAVMLYPFLGVIAVGLVWILRHPGHVADRFRLYVGGFIGASALSLGWIWLYYIPHTLHMPQEVQTRLIEGSLVNPQVQPIAHVLTALNPWPLMEPLVQYLLGLAMVFTRVAGGNVTYFNGVVTNQSFHGYFPELFVVKTQIALLILMIATIWFGIWSSRRLKHATVFERVKNSMRHHTLEWVLGSFAVFYFLVSVAGNLNLGIRHILPVYLPIFVLVAVGCVKLARQLGQTKWHVASVAVFAGLLVWYGGSTIMAHPAHTAYFNEFIGGPANSGAYFSDSSVDWGQDLKRLKTYVQEHPEITRIAVDYFGGGDPRYYFCDRAYDESGQLIATAAGYDCSRSVFEEWHSHYGRYTGQYIAISETFLENDRYYAALNGIEGYQYLRDRTPIAKVGYSIYVYKLY